MTLDLHKITQPIASAFYDGRRQETRRVELTADAIAKTTSTLDAPCRVIDLTTGLPSLTSLFSEMRPIGEHAHGATILYVHLPANPIIEENFGWEAQGAYIALVHSFLGRLAKDIQRERAHCLVVRAFADDYVVLMPHADGDEFVGSRIADDLVRHIQAVDEDLAALHEAYLGTVRIMPFTRIHPERLLYRGIQRAQTEATDVGRQKLAAQIRLLDRCLGQPECFNMVYQPLVDLKDESIFGYEALVRCTVDGLRSPHVLFNVAERGNRTWPLSRLLRHRALDPIDRLTEGALMFINIHPRDFDDPQLIGPEPAVFANAGRIVFEVTERAAIGDYDRFRANVAALRSSGVRLAIDDLGSGYAALSSVAELQPDYIKFDMTLVRNIDKSPIRQNLIRNMVAFADDTNAKVVAEGVETPEELDLVRQLGCHYAQGFYLARPGPPFIEQLEWRVPTSDTQQIRRDVLQTMIGP